jgi:hypothetical protein
VHAEARQALQGRIDEIGLKRGGQAPDPQPLGNEEGIQAIRLARVGIDALESLHQGGIEYVDAVVDLCEGRSFFEKTRQMPPGETSGFQSDPQLFDGLRFGSCLHPFRKGLGPRLAIGDSPARYYLAAVR